MRMLARADLAINVMTRLLNYAVTAGDNPVSMGPGGAARGVERGAPGGENPAWHQFIAAAWSKCTLLGPRTIVLEIPCCGAQVLEMVATVILALVTGARPTTGEVASPEHSLRASLVVLGM